MKNTTMVNSTKSIFETRTIFFVNDLGNENKLTEKFNKLYTENNGDWNAISAVLTPKNGFKPELVKKLEFSHNLAEWSNENAKLVKTFQKDENTNSMRDIALSFNKAELTKKVKEESAFPKEMSAETYAAELHNNLFRLEPTAVVQRMAGNPLESPIADKMISGSIATFLSNQPETFNLKTISIYEAFKHDKAFKNIAPDLREGVITQLKSLQRITAISPVPEVLPVLIKANLTSAMQISDIPEEQFMRTYSSELGENGLDISKQVHTAAVNSRIRNEQALIALKEVGQSTGIAFIDKSMYTNSASDPAIAKGIKLNSTEAMMKIAPQELVQEHLQKHNLSWDLLFNDADFCECGECTSVYSAAAYFVDLLQYLRNNNLDPNATGTIQIKPDPKDISNTPLEKLFKRRPDLGCLQLTCKNTNTILPYIDLVNEIMENYVVYHFPKPFNVEEDETSSELLAQPQHTEYEAYCILHKAVYPFTLPYHQPIDSARISLDYLGTSRSELIDTFRSPRKDKTELINDSETIAEVAVTIDSEKAALDALHDDFLNRATNAEFLGISQEEFIILTKEAFVSKEYWDKQCKKEHTLDEYRSKIGLKSVHEYYGYATEAAMLNNSETTKEGLTFVKDQFLRRTGVQYIELVELLKTQCLNPNVPQGKALSIMESIRFSYRFLQTLVDSGANSPKGKFVKLIDFLVKVQSSLPLLDALIHPDPCNPAAIDICSDTKDLEKWVYCYFEKAGKMIVLESGEGPRLPLQGKLFTNEQDPKWIGTLLPDGSIVDPKGTLIGKVDLSGAVLTNDLKPFIDAFGNGHAEIFIMDENGERIGYIKNNLLNGHEDPVLWLPVSDTCDLDKVRLIHLNGSPVTVNEYDSIQRYIRLWRKLGWTIDETDKALVGLGNVWEACLDDEMPDVDDCETCNDLFDDTDSCDTETDDNSCFDANCKCRIVFDITPVLLHEIVAVKKLLDKTGLELIKLLSFWTNINTSGEKSLYKRLFLTHNLIGLDKIFEADKNGNYLTREAKITEHVPILMAAFNLTSDAISEIVTNAGLEDKLNLANVSLLYRYRLLSKVLGLKIPDFISILPLFGNPFKEANATLQFIDRWGKMEDAGFNYRQLNYIIRNYDDPKKPYSPTQKTILQLAKNLYDGINTIEDTHKDVKEGDEITPEMVRNKSILLFDQSTVEKIIGIIQGTILFTTNTPKNLVITIADENTLKKKLVYDGKAGNLQITGILTLAETIGFKSLSNDPKWVESLTRIEKQQRKVFREVLSDIFENQKNQSPEQKIWVDEAEKVIKDGDIRIRVDQIPEGVEDTNTAPKKCRAFIRVFLPYLRQQLTHRFIVDTLSGLVGLDGKITDVLISEILRSGTPAKPIYSIFEAIKESAKPVSANWSGYLIPSEEASYAFIIRDSDSAPVVSIDGQPISFTAQEDPTNEWWSAIQKLQAGKLYKLVLTGIDQKNVYWKTSTSSITSIPTSLLLPDFTAVNCEPALVALKKTALLVLGFNLSVEELTYFDAHQPNFGGLDFNKLTLWHWLRLEAYTRLRNSLPATDTNILQFFEWTAKPDNASSLSQKIAELTLWKKERIDKLIADEHYDLDHCEAFRNEVNLLKIQNALRVADQIAMDIDLLFDWAKPTSNFKKCREIAESIQKSIRSQYKQEDWEQVIKPLNDKLRENQKNALIAYLLQQPDLLKWGVTDADGLFEYFLIDVQMDACMETSRIKQALSSVQLFVQRCFLGLEEEHNGITPDILDRDRWYWMQRYRVWEANRKVFLYPENWIESNLRDDKSPFFKELESELLQKDINKQNVEDALKSYLYKVDEVANMEVVGLHIEKEVDKDGNTTNLPVKLHVFSRTRNAPYFFFYRYFDIMESNWYAWEKIQVDIPSYEAEDTNGDAFDNGSFLVPVVWNRRLLIFFPQIMKKTKAVDNANTVPAKPNGDGNVNVKKPIEYYEIKMAWSEYRNGKWTQKQVSKDTINSASIADGFHQIRFFKFVPFVRKDHVLISVDETIDANTGFKGTFKFEGGKIKLTTTQNTNDPIPIVSFSKTAKTELFSWQIDSAGKRENNSLFFKDLSEKTEMGNFYTPATNFYHPYSHDLLGKINIGSLEKFFEYSLTITDKDDAFGGYDHDKNAITPNSYHELKRSYSIYNWELFFHTPMMLAGALSKAQQFEEAMKWYHFVFNPMASGTDDKRFWQYSPFKEIDAQNILESIFNQLKPNQSNQAINEWRGNPFKPHLVARSRPVAYMKWVVMKYIDNLLDWGDYLFRQDTIESLNQATQLYVLAGHILGPRPQMIPKRGKIKPQTYNSLLGKWDAFSNAMVELELAAPFSNQTTLPIGIGNGAVGLANVFGFASSLYFCIPNNPKLMAYWDTIADRLFKIRHCLNFEGIFRKLPLFEPPIDPALLVKAAAMGLSIDSVINDLNTPMPNYRFYYLLQKALELCGELKSLGSAILSALEKKDNETLSLIRAKHENTMHNLVMEIKKQQLEEATKAIEGLYQNRKLPEHRMKYYLQLIGEDVAKVPGFEGDFNELANAITAPKEESGAKLNDFEKEDMDKGARVADRQEDIGRVESLAGLLYYIPNVSVDLKPIGIGAGLEIGGKHFGPASQAIAKWMQTDTNKLAFEGTSAGKKGGFLRAKQERVLQANAAGFEIKQIDKQILSQQIRINIANLDIINQQKLIDQAQEIEDFLRNKYTNEELYSWMKVQLTTLYHQVYSISLELAKKAEKVFRFERGLSNSNYIQSGYWDAGYNGLLSGEKLYVGLKQLEAAYQEQRGYDYEITKHVSIRQINPLAILQLKETGKCEFNLPEVLFDMDYPGQYKRRIKSVSMSIPCVAGPYSGINAHLRLLEHKFRISNIAKDKGDYLEKTGESDERFMTFNIPITAIAASSAQNDSGMFELNFKDERYLPFEGGGAISKWSLELPDFRQFDYDTVTDVIMHMRIMASEGGERLKKAASGTVTDFIKSNEELGQQEGLFAIIDLKHDLPTEWHKAMQVKEGDTERLMTIDNILDFLPYYTKQDKDGKPRDSTKIKASDVVIAMHSEIAETDVSVMQDENEIQFTKGASVGQAKTIVIRDEEIKISKWKLKIKNTDKAIDKALMVVRFVI